MTDVNIVVVEQVSLLVRDHRPNHSWSSGLTGWWHINYYLAGCMAAEI